MAESDLQALCEQGQVQLMQTCYLEAVRTLESAENQAWNAGDFDTLARLYLPLQEARRQIRQRAGEGAVQMRLLAGPGSEPIDATAIIGRFSHGQLLIGGFENVGPAVQVRRLAAQLGRYVETFLGAVYQVEGGTTLVVIAPFEDSPLPVASIKSTEHLRSQLPLGCLLLSPHELPADSATGNADTFAQVMDIWERLHAPFLAVADRESDPKAQMQAYRTTLVVDPACELAHQRLAEVARKLAKNR